MKYLHQSKYSLIIEDMFLITAVLFDMRAHKYATYEVLDFTFFTLFSDTGFILL